MSVTRLIKMYEPEKDWNEIAAKYAKKHKKSIEEVQKAWKEEGRKAVEKGTKFHGEMESRLIDAGEVEIDGKRYPVFPSPLVDGIKIAIPLQLEEKLYPELLIYSHRYKVAGQADLVEIRDKKIHIKDYKTSKEIKLESYRHWKHGHEMMLFPLSHLMNCNFYHYSMQLNIYAHLLKTHNPKLKIGDLEIHHIKDDELIIYPVPDLQQEAKTLLTHYADQNI
jgi:ATP-dependent exoDNAse (exonuclease V) beta subunit